MSMQSLAALRDSLQELSDWAAWYDAEGDWIEAGKCKHEIRCILDTVQSYGGDLPVDRPEAVTWDLKNVLVYYEGGIWQIEDR